MGKKRRTFNITYKIVKLNKGFESLQTLSIIFETDVNAINTGSTLLSHRFIIM